MIESLLSSALSIFASLLGITFIVVFHEFGHFLFAKLFNVYVPTFSIGIGNKLVSKKIGATEFCISSGPIGGFVEIATEKGIDGTKGFNELNYAQKFMITLGGIFFNFLLTYLIFTGLFFTGMPDSASLPPSIQLHNPVIAAVDSSSINAAHLQPGDEIRSINKKHVAWFQTLKEEISKQIEHDEKDIEVEIIRNAQHVKVPANDETDDQVDQTLGERKTVLLNLQPEKVPMTLDKRLGVTFERRPTPPLITAFSWAITTTHFYLKAIIAGLKDMITSRHTKGLVGPLMAIAVSSKSAKKGLSSLLFLLAIISINLGFMNLLPLPIFDGGQIVIFTIETILRRELSEKVRNAIGVFSWMLAIGLLVIFTLRDIYSLIFG